MKKEKLAAILLASVMVFGLCSCTSTDSVNNSDATTTSAVEGITENDEKAFDESISSDEKETETTATAGEQEETTGEYEMKEFDEDDIVPGLTSEDMNEIYALLAKDVYEQYLEPNGISVEEFDLESAIWDEDPTIGTPIYSIHLASLYYWYNYDHDENYDSSTLTSFWDDEELINWIRADSSENRSSETELNLLVAESLFTIYFSYSDKCDALDFVTFLWELYLIPENVTFSDAQLAYAESLSEAATDRN